MGALTNLVDRGLMASDWAEALAPVEDRVASLQEFLEAEAAAGRPYLPEDDAIFRAFRAPMATVRVLIVGQDPYPTPGHPIGLSFAVEPHVRPLPKSLVNIYRELQSDLPDVVPPAHGDLTGWADQGVMLLNRVLTVQAHVRDSHRRKGWEKVTEHAIRALVARAQDGPPFVAVLWGGPARTLTKLLGSTPFVEAAHPSPLSANKGGFFGTRPFSTVNALLVERGAEPVDWGAFVEGDPSAGR